MVTFQYREPLLQVGAVSSFCPTGPGPFMPLASGSSWASSGYKTWGKGYFGTASEKEEPCFLSVWPAKPTCLELLRSDSSLARVWVTI